MFTILLSLLFFPQPSSANSYNQECSKSALKLVKPAIVEKYGSKFDAHSVEKVILETFENTTPGSYDQEYEMTFQVVFKAGSTARKSLDGFATFYSGFICENLELTSIELN